MDPAISQCSTCYEFLCDVHSVAHQKGKVPVVISMEEAKSRGINLQSSRMCKVHQLRK
jgi:hypothetical protein